jgi:hypothetical protein
MKLIGLIIKFLRRLFGFADRSQAPDVEARWTRPVVELAEWKSAGNPPPMMWKQCHLRTRAIFKAELTCSNGHAISLRSHSIHADGMVSPSVVCRAPGCDFHDFVRLDAWSSGEL